MRKTEVYRRSIDFHHDQGVEIVAIVDDPYAIVELEFGDATDDVNLSLGTVEAESIRDALNEALEAISARIKEEQEEERRGQN